MSVQSRSSHNLLRSTLIVGNCSRNDIGQSAFLSFSNSLLLVGAVDDATIKGLKFCDFKEKGAYPFMVCNDFLVYRVTQCSWMPK